MPSNKEVLEAQRYNRKRLITAFTSGTPGGRELEPRGLLYPLVVGVILSAVIIVVGVVIARFAPTLPDGWDNKKLIVVNETGARYFTMEGILYPVSSITFARLMTDPGEFTPIRVGASALEGKDRGPEIGIAGIPDDIPPLEQLRGDTWTSCAGNTDMIYTWVAAETAGLKPTGVTVAKNGDESYLIIGGKRYLISDQGVQNALFLDKQPYTYEVNAGWLNLFETGSVLAPLELKDYGKQVSGMPPRLGKLAVGSLLQVRNTDSTFLILGDSLITPISEVQRTMLALNSKYGTIDEHVIDENELVKTITIDQNAEELSQDWPQLLPEEQAAEDFIPCATLTVTPDSSMVGLAAIPRETVESDNGRVKVAGGYGALIRASDGTMGAVRLIADSGQAFSLGENPDDTLSRFGYPAERVLNVPGAWVALVPMADSELTNQAAAEAVNS